MNESQEPAGKPRFGVGTRVSHAIFGPGRVVGYEKDNYLLLVKDGEIKHVAFTFEGMSAVESAGDPELDMIKQAVGEVLGEHGWFDAELEMGARWRDGVLKLIPGKEGTQSKEIPMESFFKKIIGVREKLRVLEQKINNHPSLGPEEKIELEGYLTRCYGSLTSFNVLFSGKGSHFKGSGKG